mmetsp:Transcript_12553/g.20910  ORF Transcript_12553/g.20910 Transcript_12553/m.20910 type:complete len:119 (+) Transcript_12553:438-794(+)
MKLESNSRCPELVAASRFALQYGLPPIKMFAIQLLGKWAEKASTAVTRQLYEHNQVVCRKLGIETLAVTDYNHDSRKPPFWKMNLIRDACQTGEYDAVWFLDGDVLLTNEANPIKALW